ERLHGDGIAITTESPEAMEEPLWMAFFPTLHDGTASQVLDANSHHAAFERFYADHLRKVMLLRGGTRYLAKANYHITRLEYLLRMFPDARFVVPVRAPDAHVASLMRQHARFCTLHRSDPRTLRYMQRLGHFEFGLDRRPIHTGPRSQVAQTLADWAAGRELDGLARQWADVYGHLAQLLTSSRVLREATVLVRHEDLLANPEATLARVISHCRLSVRHPELIRLAQGIRQVAAGSGLEVAQCQRVRSLVDDVADLYGYQLSSSGGRFASDHHGVPDLRAEGIS
ncbi:MAG: sulfotransferase, partial [Pseudomonadota bacterium]